ncbi:MAG: arginase [Clostridium sp.]
MKINVIGVPLFYGCDNPGVDQGPSTLRQGGDIELLHKAGNEVVDLGDIDIIYASETEKYNDDDHAKFMSVVLDASEKLASKVDKSIREGAFPLTIGGDHALGLGSVAGASKACDNLDEFAVVWFDAHADINTIETSPSGNIHGMPIAGSIGIDEKLSEVYFKGIKVKPENLILIGQRDIDSGEEKILAEHNITVFRMEQVRELGVQETMRQVLDILKGKNIKNVHFSYDIDGIDPTFIEGTGTRVPEGFNMEDAQYVIRELIGTNLVKSMDLVEFNPRLEKGMTLANCLLLTDTIAKSVAKIK